MSDETTDPTEPEPGDVSPTGDTDGCSGWRWPAPTAGVLADSSDLLAHVAASDLIDEDGNPDLEGIREAADSLLERKPHLAPRTPTGDVGQGPRGKPVRPRRTTARARGVVRIALWMTSKRST